MTLAHKAYPHPPFHRECDIHRVNIDRPSKGLGRETLVCPMGHRCYSWLVVDSEGVTIATAYDEREDIEVAE